MCLLYYRTMSRLDERCAVKGRDGLSLIWVTVCYIHWCILSTEQCRLCGVECYLVHGGASICNSYTWNVLKKEKKLLVKHFFSLCVNTMFSLSLNPSPQDPQDFWQIRRKPAVGSYKGKLGEIISFPCPPLASPSLDFPTALSSGLGNTDCPLDGSSATALWMDHHTVIMLQSWKGEL